MSRVEEAVDRLTLTRTEFDMPESRQAFGDGRITVAARIFRGFE